MKIVFASEILTFIKVEIKSYLTDNPIWDKNYVSQIYLVIPSFYSFSFLK